MWVQTLAAWSWRNNITFFYRKLHSSKMTLKFFTLASGQYFHCLWAVESLTFLFSYVLLGRNRFGGLKSDVYLKSFFAVTQATWNQILESFVLMVPSSLPRTALLYCLDLVVHEDTVIISFKKQTNTVSLVVYLYTLMLFPFCFL